MPRGRPHATRMVVSGFTMPGDDLSEGLTFALKVFILSEFTWTTLLVPKSAWKESLNIAAEWRQPMQ